MGLFSDVYPRTVILGAAVILFSLSTTLMAAATEYWHLVVLRMIYAAGYVATYMVVQLDFTLEIEEFCTLFGRALSTCLL